MSKSVAIIGAGPAGIVCARFLIAHGFQPVLFEAHTALGGQWNSANPMSGVWRGMRTNTPRMLTRFSDSDYGAEVPLFPRADHVLHYLIAYAERFEVLPCVKFGATVINVSRKEHGYSVVWIQNDTRESCEFPFVVVASGRYNSPAVPPILGLRDYRRERTAIHAAQYEGPSGFAGKNVLVAGGNISALEIATELAMSGTSSVTVTMRRQRYIVPKLIAGVPVESYCLTRENALWRDTASEDEVARFSLAFALKYGGHPARYGAPSPDPDIRKAGATGSLSFLPFVAEGRIKCKPWLEGLDEERATFRDGTTLRADSLIFGTGYKLDLPFLSSEIRATLGGGSNDMPLADYTFHPALPGMAFVGFWRQVGAYLPPLEQQARYVTYAWAGLIRGASATCEGPDLAAPVYGQDVVHMQHQMTIRLARLAQIDPAGRVPGWMERTLSRSAVTGLMFRIVGPDALDDAFDQLRAEFGRYGLEDPAMLWNSARSDCDTDTSADEVASSTKPS